MSGAGQVPGKGPVSEKAPLWRRLLPIIGGLVVVVVLFGWVLPQFIDYEAVFRSIGNIDAVEWLILIVVAAVRFMPEGWIYVAAQPGLSLGQGTQLFLVSETLANVPPGGLDLVSRYQMARSWGYPPSSSTSATVASWIFTTLGKLVLPIAAVAFLAIRRVRADELDALAAIAFVIVAVGAVGLYFVLRSPRLAGRVGELLGAAVHWVSGIFRREVKTDFRNLVLEFRVQSSDVLRRRTPVGFAAGVAARLVAFLVLILAIRFVGLEANQLHWTQVFGAYAFVVALSVIPIFSMPGLFEVVLIGTFNAIVGGEGTDQVAAAVFVYRILTWILPIPFGGFIFTRWRDRVRATGKTELLDAFDDPASAPDLA